MKTISKWQRVGQRRLCPICDKPDWCLYSGPEDSPTAVICARIESQKRCGESGWLHILDTSGPTWSPLIRRIELSAVRIGTDDINLESLAEQYQSAVKGEAFDKLAESLGLSIESLRRLGVGWSAKHSAWAFPMLDAQGKVLGIRLRLHGGKKLSVKGGREGLFIPKTLDNQGPLLIAEGPTDTAALLDLGFPAVGRPSCTGGVKLLIEFVRKYNPASVVIVADADVPGQRGAENLASVLAAYCQAVCIITPPAGVKDAREWKRRGATAADVQAMIDAAPVRKLTVSARIRRNGIKHGR
jgi:hypothetical protein